MTVYTVIPVHPLSNLIHKITRKKTPRFKINELQWDKLEFLIELELNWWDIMADANGGFHFFRTWTVPFEGFHLFRTWNVPFDFVGGFLLLLLCAVGFEGKK